jgi:hypothetical protein
VSLTPFEFVQTYDDVGDWIRLPTCRYTEMQYAKAYITAKKKPEGVESTLQKAEVQR